jgi:hypothetical protein
MQQDELGDGKTQRHAEDNGKLYFVLHAVSLSPLEVS